MADYISRVADPGLEAENDKLRNYIDELVQAIDAAMWERVGRDHYCWLCHHQYPRHYDDCRFGPVIAVLEKEAR